MYCKNCGEHIENGATACPKCGAALNEAYLPRYTTELFYCKSCGAEVAKEDKFCPHCAAELDFTDLIAEALNHRLERKKETPFKWEFVPEYPAKEEERDEEEPETEEEPMQAPAPAPAEEEPATVQEQAAAPSPAPEAAEEPSPSPAPTPFDITYTDTAPVVPPENRTQNPDLAFTGTQRNESAPTPVYRATDGGQSETDFIPNTRGELKNYSVDDGKSAPKPTMGTDVIASKSKPFKDRKALGVMAIIFSILLPPIGIILGIIAVSRGWTAMNRFYVRLGTVAIILGVITTIALSFALAKWIIPALQDLINSKRNLMFLFM